MEVLILVTGVLALFFLFRVRNDTVENAQRGQWEEPFGPKRWHWTAAAFLGVSFLVLTLLSVVTDSG